MIYVTPFHGNTLVALLEERSDRQISNLESGSRLHQPARWCPVRMGESGEKQKSRIFSCNYFFRHQQAVVCMTETCWCGGRMVRQEACPDDATR